MSYFDHAEWNDWHTNKIKSWVLTSYKSIITSSEFVFNKFMEWVRCKGLHYLLLIMLILTMIIVVVILVLCLCLVLYFVQKIILINISFIFLVFCNNDYFGSFDSAFNNRIPDTIIIIIQKSKAYFLLINNCK